MCLVLESDLRLRKTVAVRHLGGLSLLEYPPITTPVMRRAAELWAEARQQGKPKAGDRNLDVDVILAAQVLLLNDPDAVIATTNLRHLSTLAPAALWQDITSED